MPTRSRPAERLTKFRLIGIALAASSVGANACGGSSEQPFLTGSAGASAAGTAHSAAGSGQAAGGAPSATASGGGGQSGSASGGSGAFGNAAGGGLGGGAGQAMVSGGQGGFAAGGNGQGGGGATTVGGQGGAAGSNSTCVPTKAWGTADPAVAGPFAVTTETNIGPAAGIPDPKYNNTVPHFNLYRPTDLSQGYCHPIITWGNGTGDQPKTYEVLIKQLASHGFVVVASLSSQTAQGTPLPQIAGVDWMIQQNSDPTSALYHHLDTAHIGATGHSQGGAATTMAGADPRITAIAPIAGSRANITLHGPAALLCGGMDTTVPCSSVKSAFDSINDVPVMLGDDLGDTHGSWIGSIKNPYMVAVTGWMRVHLMGDTSNRNLFYGASCKLCTDTQHWQIQRKGMDQ